ncbi:hypothetical protein chiPu_0012277 [Chiloscyllium punctatum]|uniref:Uncharacterized protein n=1 Tax=Chiloscyllium punctatum TaxID=137246 RepID=A0A401STV9_CHIPU|nr:hypothetical protein [Chiloscyllium punctatum]
MLIKSANEAAERAPRLLPMPAKGILGQTRPDQPRPDQTRPAQTSPDQTRSDQTKPDQIRPDQIRPDQIRPDQTRSDQTRPDQTRSDQTRPDQTRPDQTRPDQTRSDQTRPDQTRPAQTRSDQTRPDYWLGKPRPLEFGARTHFVFSCRRYKDKEQLEPRHMFRCSSCPEPPPHLKPPKEDGIQPTVGSLHISVCLSSEKPFYEVSPERALKKISKIHYINETW